MQERKYQVSLGLYISIKNIIPSTSDVLKKAISILIFSKLKMRYLVLVKISKATNLVKKTVLNNQTIEVEIKTASNIDLVKRRELKLHY